VNGIHGSLVVPRNATNGGHDSRIFCAKEVGNIEQARVDRE
jgi:hypothetical protein